MTGHVSSWLYITLVMVHGPQSMGGRYGYRRECWFRRYEQTSLTSHRTDDPHQRETLGPSAWATWNKAEEDLRFNEDVEADVFAILDTCFASNLPKGDTEEESARSYQLLSACGFDQTTTNNKDRSFTRALIETLKRLLVEYENKSFTPDILREQINLHPTRRHEQSHVWNRLHNTGMPISLAPLDKVKSQQDNFTEPAKGHLTLRFALKHSSLNQDQMHRLAKQLSRCFEKDSSVKGIAYVGFREPNRTNEFKRTAVAYRVLHVWRAVINKRREKGILKKFCGPSPKNTHGMSGTARPPTKKRGREDDPYFSDSSPPSPQKSAKLRTISTSSPTRHREDDDEVTPLTPRTMTPPQPA